MKPYLLLSFLVIGCSGGVGGAITNDGGVDAISPVDGGACSVLGADVAVEGSATIYPSYAIDGCRLAYVQRGTQRLVLRDLATATERFLTDIPATVDDVPRRPTLGDGFVAWEVGAVKTSAVKLATANGTKTIAGAFDHAGEPRAWGSSVVFTGWMSTDPLGDTDVFLYDLAADAVSLVAAGPGQQRFADVNEGFVVFTDFSEDPDGRYDQNDTDLADLVVFDRKTLASSPRKLPGKQAFPVLVAGDHFGYLHWGDVHPEPKFQAFGVRGAKVGAAPTSDAIIADVTNATRFFLPSGRGGTLDWIAPGPTEGELLWRAPVDGSVVKKSVLVGQNFVGSPQTSTFLTVVAVSTPSGATLTAVAR